MRWAHGTLQGFMKSTGKWWKDYDFYLRTDRGSHRDCRYYDRKRTLLKGVAAKIFIAKAKPTASLLTKGLSWAKATSLE